MNAILLRLLVAAWLACVCASHSHAAPQAVSTQVSGSGPSAEAAARTAIIDALRRVNAPTVGANAALAARFESAMTELEQALSAPEITLSRVEAEAPVLSKGALTQVKVLDQRPLSDAGAVSVTLLLSIVRFDQLSADRKTLAVVPFRSASPAFAFGSMEVQAADLARRLADRTTQLLVQSAVVTVLDREFVEAAVRERAFVEAHGRTPEELARFGRMLGADYLVVGSIESAGMAVTTRTVEASGYTLTQAMAGLNANVRLIDVATGAILAADKVDAFLPNGELLRLSGGQPANPLTVVDRLVQDVSMLTTDLLVTTIAPIKVALVDGDTLWLNRGSGRLTPGQRLAIRGGGRDIIDPDTGENLGQAERTLAVIEVVSCDAKKSQCRLLEGQVVDVRVGQIARPLAAP